MFEHDIGGLAPGLQVAALGVQHVSLFLWNERLVKVGFERSARLLFVVLDLNEPGRMLGLLYFERAALPWPVAPCGEVLAEGARRCPCDG